MITIRKARPTQTDTKQIRRLYETAFGQAKDADLVERLWRDCPDLLSLVAEARLTIVGHVLFSPVRVEGPRPAISAMGLGPLAVLPERQGQGIGTALVTHGVDILRGQACPCVVVLGRPEFYQRLGFEKGADHGLERPWSAVSEEAFLVKVLDADKMRGVGGLVRYPKVFDRAAWPRS